MAQLNDDTKNLDDKPAPKKPPARKPRDEVQAEDENPYAAKD